MSNLAEMNPEKVIGLLKFFENTNYLYELLEGRVYCNSAEYYRNSSTPGVSDHYECSIFTYRNLRSDNEGKITFTTKDTNRIVPINITNATVRNADENDQWLHCWFTVTVPENPNELSQLQTDIEKMRQLFGSNYVFIKSADISNYLTRLKAASQKVINAGFVHYTDHKPHWSIFCKSSEFSYQRECRFSFGDCPDMGIEPYTFDVKSGFEDIFYVNKDLALSFGYKDGRTQTLNLTATESRITTT